MPYNTPNNIAVVGYIFTHGPNAAVLHIQIYVTSDGYYLSHFSHQQLLIKTMKFFFSKVPTCKNPFSIKSKNSIFLLFLYFLKKRKKKKDKRKKLSDSRNQNIV